MKNGFSRTSVKISIILLASAKIRLKPKRNLIEFIRLKPHFFYQTNPQATASGNL